MTPPPTIDGLSEITGFGNATWVTSSTRRGRPDLRPDHRRVRPGQVAGQAIPLNAGNSTDGFGNFAIPIDRRSSSNGLKTIEIYTTDNAGSESNKVTLTFILQATDIVTSAADHRRRPRRAGPVTFATDRQGAHRVRPRDNPVTNLTARSDSPARRPRHLHHGHRTGGRPSLTLQDARHGPDTTRFAVYHVPTSGTKSIPDEHRFSFTLHIDSTALQLPAPTGPREHGTFTVVATATYVPVSNNVGQPRRATSSPSRSTTRRRPR